MGVDSLTAQTTPLDTAKSRAAATEQTALSVSAGVTDSLTVLRALLEEHGRTATASGNFIIRYTVEIRAMDGCTVTLAKHTESSNVVDDLLSRIDLARLDPNPVVKVLDEASDAWTVRLQTSTGRDDILAMRKFVITGRAPRDTVGAVAFAEIPLQTRVRADRVALLVQSAVRLCGGKPMNPEVAARVNAPKDFSGNPLSDSTFVRVKAQCRALVKDELRSPTTAEFSTDSATMAYFTKSGGLLVLGKVASQNGFGATLQKNYSCSFNKENDAWLPSGKPLIF